MLRFAKMSIVLLIPLLIFTSCERANQMVSDVHTKHHTDETPGTPVTLLSFIDYPDGGKDAYLQWDASVTPTLQAPEEVLRIRAYENTTADMSPHRMVKFEFGSLLDARTYMNRPEVFAIFEDLPNHAPKDASYLFVQQSSYQRDEPHHGEHSHYPIKSIMVINYHHGGRDAYLEWAASVVEIRITPDQLKSLSMYENDRGESPNRLVVGEFASKADLDAYNALPEIQAVEAELHTQAYDSMELTFELQADYVATSVMKR